MNKFFNVIITVVLLVLIVSCSDDNPVETGKKVTIVSISPRVGDVGETITINGTNFGTVRNSSLVSFAGTNATTYLSWSDSQISVEVPPEAKSGKLWVIVNGEISNEIYFTIRSEESKESVVIGTQVWMKKNLDVKYYRNGDLIPQVKDPSEWYNLKTGAWCYYKNDSANGEVYGKLYNWYAISDPRGLAPEGWRIPSNKDWQDLYEILGGISTAGRKLKAKGTIEGGDGLWKSPNFGATNEAGFSALPGGYCANIGHFSLLGEAGYWWSSSLCSWIINNSSSTLYVLTVSSKTNGFSVRCLRD